MSRIFVIDDDEELCSTLKFHLKANGHEPGFATSAAEGLRALAGQAPDLILLDLNLPDRGGMEVLKALHGSHPESAVAIITGEQDTKATIEAMRLGALDYLRKPFGLDDVLILIEKVGKYKSLLTQPLAALPAEDSKDPLEIVGSSRKIVEVIKQIGLLSRSQVTVLIEGESGTGKELVARVLHESSSNAKKPFVAINCSAVVPTLLESELFGYEKGAFTGADSRKTGKLEYAGGGSVFFDEIGDMPLEPQAKILRVLQQREFERVGGLESLPLEARVIAATNRNLGHLVEEGRFREDLYYRLAVARIVLPPLRERREDIPLLVSHLTSRIALALHRRIEGCDKEAVLRMQRYDWPGNVRELENVLSRAIALARGSLISPDDLNFSLQETSAVRSGPEGLRPLAEVEKEHIEKTLISTGWNITRSARSLGIAPNTLRSKIAEYGLRKSL